MRSIFKNYPYIMKPLLFILLFSGIGTILIIILLIINNFDDFKSGHAEILNYIFNKL